MTQPTMLTPEEIASRCWRGSPASAPILVLHARKLIVDVLTADRAAHAAMPRVSRAPKSEVVKLIAEGRLIYDPPVLLSKISKLTGLTWPEEQTMRPPEPPPAPQNVLITEGSQRVEGPVRPNSPTQSEASSLRASLAGEIAVMGKPLDTTPPRPDLSKWPEWELSLDSDGKPEYRCPKNGETFWGNRTPGPVKAYRDFGTNRHFILRRVPAAPQPAPASDEAEVERLTRLGMAAAGRKYGNALGYDDCDDEERGAAKEFARAVLAAIPKRRVSADQAREAFNKGSHGGMDAAWAAVIRLCGCEVGEEKADTLLERLRGASAGGDGYTINLLEEAAAEIERLRGGVE